MNLHEIWRNIKYFAYTLYRKNIKMKYNHLANLKELDEKVFILNGYDYSENDPKGLAELFFQFCQINLSENNKEFNIQPARFYVRDVTTVNALATKRNEYYVIGINIGTIVTMHNFFDTRQQVLDTPTMSDFKSLNNKLDTQIPVLMYQICTQFTYYHELAHLIQFSSGGKNSQNSTAQLKMEVEEAYAQGTGPADPYSMEKHIREFDADLNGGHFTCLHLIDYWKRLDAADKTQANLELLLSLGVASVLSYFIFLLTGYPPIYYEASDHPHPLIRVLYIIDLYIKTSQINLPESAQIQLTDILQRAFSLTQAIFIFGGGEDKVKVFSDTLAVESEGITHYINQVLIPQSRLMPELVMNRRQAFEKNKI